MKVFVIVLLFLVMLVVSGTCDADTHIAASCSAGDVQTAINASSDGDIVYFPVAPCAVTWTSGVTVNKEIALSGRTTACPDACVDNTVINNGSIAIQANNVRVTGITLSGENATIDVHITGGGLSGWRIDHNHFKDIGQITPSKYSIRIGRWGSAGENIRRNYPGLIDNNSFTGAVQNKAIQMYGGCGTYSDWKDTLTLGGSSFLFIEDNKFVHTTLTDGVSSFDCDSGGRFVMRYNTFTNGWINTHGVNDGGPDGDPTIHTGAHAWEIYNNTFNGNVPYWIRANMRGGTGVIHHNSWNFDRKDRVSTPFIFQYYRGDVGPYCTGTYSCAGHHSIDGNQNSSGYPCYQQIGVTGSSGITKSPVYEWSNTWQGVACGNSGYDCFDVYYSSGCPPQHVQLGRDVIQNGTTPKPGYAPYTYPHPLTSGVLVPPKGLRIVP